MRRHQRGRIDCAPSAACTPPSSNQETVPHWIIAVAAGADATLSAAAARPKVVLWNVCIMPTRSLPDLCR